MWNWIASNSEVLNLALTGLMLIVWGLYFQLLLNGYRRSRRSRILINRANGHGLGTQCVVTNMSAEAIYIEGVIAELATEGEKDKISCSLTDSGGRIDPNQQAGEDGYQGPLGSGKSVGLGPYSKIIEHVLEHAEKNITAVRGMTLTVVATYGPEDRPVAAQRSYEIVERAGRRILNSGTVTTRQIRSKSERRRIEEEMGNQVAARSVERE